MLKYFIERPMACAAVAACGLSVALYYLNNLSFYIGAALIAVFFVLVARGADMKLLTVVFILVVVCISYQYTAQKLSNAETMSGLTVTGEFKVTEDVIKGDGYSRTVIKSTDCEKLPQNTKCILFYTDSELKCGDKIIAQVKLSKIDDKYKLYDYSEGIFLTASAKHIELTGETDKMLQFAAGSRKYIISTLLAAFDKDIAATLCAVICGDRGYMSDEFYNNVKASGITHIMVVSGMHLAIIMGMITWLIRKLFYNRWFILIISILLVLYISAVCGFSMSIIRAGVTYILAAVAPFLNRDNCPANSLGCAVCLMLTASPFSVFSIAFQLSVLSTFGVIVVAPEFYRMIQTKSKALNTVISAATVCLSATIMTAPITVYHFGYISLVCIITSLLVSFAATWALCSAVLGLSIKLIFPSLADPFFFVGGILTKYVNGVINYLGGLKHSTLTVGKWSTLLFVGVIFVVIEIMSACKMSRGMVKLEKINKKVIKETRGKGRIKWL